MPLNPIGSVAFMGAAFADLTSSIDYEALRRAGVGAVYLRAGVGCDISDALSAQSLRAADAGLRAGAWHVLTAADVPGARAQARRFLDAIRPLALPLRPAMQLGELPGRSIEGANAVAMAFLETVDYGGGVVPVLYTAADSARLLWSAALAERFDLWVIDNGADAPDGTGSPWTGWVGWQYTDTAAIAGVSGPVRLSRFTDAILAAMTETCPVPAPWAGISAFPAPGGADQGSLASPTPALRTGELSSPAAPGTKLICVVTAYGDTLSGIAALFGTTVGDIARINAIRDPDRLFPGTRLILRVADSVPIPPCESYIVQSGDTLSGIAGRLGVSMDALIARNAIANPGLIYPGQVLFLPTESV